ncbi:MAG: hypothetical protein ACT4PQ_05735 [Betaproteobacteria bacterium]
MRLLLLMLLLPATALALDNDFVRVTRNKVTCPQANMPGCGERVIVALHDMEIFVGYASRQFSRGDIMVFERDKAVPPPAGEFFEVVIKPDHPPVLAPAEIIAPEKNAMRYEGERFFVFEEKLAPGDTRARHRHSQRVVIQLNKTRLQQWPDGEPEKFVEIPIEQPGFSPPVIHVVKNVGAAPLFGIVIEFKPEKK